MSNLKQILEQNRKWADKVIEKNPNFFKRLLKIQNPEFLWIGCSDSRVPANQITGLAPGEVFVHRNVANLVVHTDLNCLSVVHYAIDALKIKTIIVCGHYGCGGVTAAYKNIKFGLIDNWLRHVQDLAEQFKDDLKKIKDEEQQLRRLCELNVIHQVRNVAKTTIVQDAWARGQEVTIHGVIYDIRDGLLKDVHATVDNPSKIDSVYRSALDAHL